jgi:hypothetical protein
MFAIAPSMLEPTTASIAMYLLLKQRPSSRRLLSLKRPMRVCRWIKVHRRELADSVWDELAEPMLVATNTLPHWTVMTLYTLLWVCIFLL